MGFTGMLFGGREGTPLFALGQIHPYCPLNSIPAETLRRAFSTPFAILALSVHLGVQLAAFFEIY